MESERSVPTWALIAALVVTAAFAACSDKSDPNAGPAGTGLYVQKSWSVAREVSGHRVHVVQAKLACSACHALTGTRMTAVTPDTCATCHAAQARIEHARARAEQDFGPGSKADCRLCHAFTMDAAEHARLALEASQAGAAGAGAAGDEGFAGFQPFSPGDCGRCHEAAQGSTPAVTVHASQPCQSCHHPHDDPSPQSAPCSSCHAEITTAHAASGRTVTQACRVCHEQQHAGAAEARGGCVDCHSTREPVIPRTALFASGHRECVSCHEPHAFESGRAVPCANCHRLNVLGNRAGKPAAHGSCTSCHSAHDVRGSAVNACASCHRDVHPDHPKFGAGGACLGCHDPHPSSSSAESAARACGSCHAPMAVNRIDHAAHGSLPCNRCHEPHQFQLATGDRSLCSGCHALRVEQTSANRGHSDCTGCHAGLPHAPQATAAECRACHADEHAAARSGHTRCASCHEPHSGSQAAPCRSCHAAEHTAAPRGHQACASCHEPHGGTANVQPCSACHASEASTPHGRAQQSCTGCHRAHGPEGKVLVPCAACHSVASLPGLHRGPEHRNCTGCHTGHGDSRPSQREACVGCHRDRLQHFPDGACASCHLFGLRQP